MIRQTYAAVMDPERNPFQRLPKTVAFQLMVTLSLMWSIIFCVWIGVVGLIGPSMLAHTVLLIGLFFTADIFRRARSR